MMKIGISKNVAKIHPKNKPINIGPIKPTESKIIWKLLIPCALKIPSDFLLSSILRVIRFNKEIIHPSKIIKINTKEEIQKKVETKLTTVRFKK